METAVIGGHGCYSSSASADASSSSSEGQHWMEDRNLELPLIPLELAQGSTNLWSCQGPRDLEIWNLRLSSYSKSFKEQRVHSF
jgi:hypothetical protein